MIFGVWVGCVMDSDGFRWDHRGLIHDAIDISLESAENGKTNCMSQMDIIDCSSFQGAWLKTIQKIQRGNQFSMENTWMFGWTDAFVCSHLGINRLDRATMSCDSQITSFPEQGWSCETLEAGVNLAASLAGLSLKPMDANQAWCNWGFVHMFACTQYICMMPFFHEYRNPDIYWQDR